MNNWVRENDAVMLIGKAAIMLAERNSDGSVNEDRVNAMVEKLLVAAHAVNHVLNRPWPPESGPQPPAPKPRPVLRLVPKSPP